jgi:[acyl-carrier-protein] S-malonyltransferase
MVLACLRELELPFHFAAGHSLGEYSALCAAGVFSFEEGLKLVRLRGRLMAQAGDKRPGAMSAIIGLTPETLNAVLAKAQSAGTVVAANYNSLTQTVISGDRGAVAKAEDYCREAGAGKVVRIPVGGAFHSPLMAFAQEGLGQALADTLFSVPEVPVITNVDAEPCESPDLLKSGLIRQLVSPVRWVESFTKAVSLGCSHGLEVGPGKVLMGLGRGISREMKIIPVESPKQLQKAGEFLTWG